MNPLTYLRQTWDELKRVQWPQPAQAIKLTVLVIVISVAVGLYIGGLDLAFTNLLTLIVK